MRMLRNGVKDNYIQSNFLNSYILANDNYSIATF